MTETEENTEALVEQRGRKWYEETIRPVVETDENLGKIVAIDIETGTYGIDKDLIKAGQIVRAQHPDAELWFERIGYDAVMTFDGSSCLPVIFSNTAYTGT